LVGANPGATGVWSHGAYIDTGGLPIDHGGSP
jgi:hypothetical protein